ncbi:MAG: hypothetical protein IPF47_17870 [Gemmatimonadetes bacterium]|nr:hypothetical protein [Gemmatimonadota bacterium]
MAIAPPYRYAETAPSPALAEWVLSFWHFAADASPPADAPFAVWPDGCTSVAIVSLPRIAPMLTVVGPRATSFQPGVVAGMRLVGMRLWPDATPLVLALSPRALRDRQGPPPPTLAARFASAVAAIPANGTSDEAMASLDRWMHGERDAFVSPDPRVRRAIHAVASARGEATVTQVARAAGSSIRQLQRLFPGRPDSRSRVCSCPATTRGTLALRLSNDAAHWSRIAAERSFADHAHLTREFVALAGLRPTDAARQLSLTAHDNVAP